MKKSTFILLMTCSLLSEITGQQYYTTEHFRIQYDIDKVPSRKDKSYLPPGVNPAQLSEFGDPDWEDDIDNPGKKRRTIPYYIQDIGNNLETALSKYVTLGLIKESELVQTGSGTDFNANATGDEPENIKISIKVIVKALADNNGNAIDGENDPLTGTIYLNENVPTSVEEPVKYYVLRKACAHELMHYITHRNYSGLFTKWSAYSGSYSQQWWWECLAVQADRLVFPDQKPFESEVYAMDKNCNYLYGNVMESWDNCNNDPGWYVSSSFLTYLLYYRDGKKADFKDIFFAPIVNFENIISLNRTSLDKYVKKSLDSRGLGYEYQDYLNWLLRAENKSLRIPSGTDTRVYQTNVALKNENFQNVSRYDANIPYMALKSYRIFQGSTTNEKKYKIVNHKFTEDEIVKIVGDQVMSKSEPITTNCNMYVYEGSNEGRKLIKQLLPGDSLEIVYQNKKWIEVVIINPGMGNQGKAALEIIRYPSLAGTYKGAIKFSGTNPKLDEMYTIHLSTFEIIIDSTGKAEINFEFHKSYRKDGFYAKADNIKGKVESDGSFKIVGLVKAFFYPKGCSTCCDFPQVKDDPKCIKMGYNPYFWKFEGQIVQNLQGRQISGYIAAGMRPDKFMKLSEKLYKFEAIQTE